MLGSRLLRLITSQSDITVENGAAYFRHIIDKGSRPPLTGSAALAKVRPFDSDGVLGLDMIRPREPAYSPAKQKIRVQTPPAATDSGGL